MSNRTNPYVGLRPFNSDESLLFFGRNRQSLEILQRLNSNRFVAIVGSSGCGKSSLVKAGVIPSLQAGFLVGEMDQWHIIQMKPGRDPLYNLAHAFLSELTGDASGKNVEDLVEKIYVEGADALLSLVEEHSSNTNNNIFLLADQFEELFRFSVTKDKKDESVEFVNLLLELSNQDQMPIYTVLTMRSDFIGDCSQFQGLPEALNQSQYLVPKLTRDQLKLAIEGPAKLYGRQITPRLLSRLINDLNGVKDDLPLLQHCLLRIWEHEEKQDNNRELDINDYKAIGTVENALAQHANQALDQLKPKQKKLAEYIFKALTTIDENGRKIRRPALLSDLASLTKSSSEEILEVANKFIEEGRSFLILQKIGGSSDVNIDISHESLIRQWDTLSRWVEEEAEAASIYLQIAKANSLKKESKRGYLDGIELQLAQKWIANNNPSAEWAKGYRHDYAEVITFLEESEDEYFKNERKKRARTRWIQGLLVGVIILLLIAVGAFYWYIQEEETRSAAQEKHLAAVEILMDDPTKAYALEEEAYSIFPDTVYTNSAQKIKETYTLYKNRGNFSDQPLKENVYRPNAISHTGEWIFYKDSSGVGILQNNANKNKREFDANVLTSSMNLSDFFIYGTDERKVLKYNYESHEPKEIFSLADDEVTFLTTDNDRIFVGTNKARVYQLSVNGDLQKEWSFRAVTNVEDMPYAPIYDIAVGPEQRLAVVDRKGRVFITKDSDYEQLKLSGKALVTDISNNSTIAIGFSNGAIKLFDIEGGSISNFKAHAQSVNYLSFVGSGDFILSSSKKGETVLWNLEGDRRQGFTGHKKSVFGHILENKGNTLITYSLDGSIKEWNLNESLGGIFLVDLGEDLTTNILSKKDKGPLLYDQDNIITHYLSRNGLDKINLDSGIQSSIETSGQTCSGFIRKIAISPDKQNILGFCDTSNLVIINAEGEIIQRFPDQGIVKDLAFAPDGKSVLIGLLTGIVKKYSIETGDEENSFPGHTFGVSAIAVSSSTQNLMAVGTDDHSIKIWNLNNDEPVKTITLPSSEYVNSLEFSSDAKKLYIGTIKGELMVWEIETNQEDHKLSFLHSNGISHLQISDNGKYLITLSKGGTLALINVEIYQEKWFSDQSYEILGAGFMNSGEELITLSSRGQLRIWDIETAFVNDRVSK